MDRTRGRSATRLNACKPGITASRSSIDGDGHSRGDKGSVALRNGPSLTRSRALVPRDYSTAKVTSVLQVMSTLSPTLT